MPGSKLKVNKFHRVDACISFRPKINANKPFLLHVRFRSNDSSKTWDVFTENFSRIEDARLVRDLIKLRGFSSHEALEAQRNMVKCKGVTNRLVVSPKLRINVIKQPPKMHKKCDSEHTLEMQRKYITPCASVVTEPLADMEHLIFIPRMLNVQGCELCSQVNATQLLVDG